VVELVAHQVGRDLPPSCAAALSLKPAVGGKIGMEKVIIELDQKWLNESIPL